jgi:hypothetical protein
VSRRRKSTPLASEAPAAADGDVAADMAALAEAFVGGAAQEGHHFDYAVENAPRLDALVDLFLESQPGDDVVNSMVLNMGAYVGELIVRNGGGTWTFDQEAGAPGVRLTSGLIGFPLNKVGKRITVGGEHSISRFVEVAMAGDLPPDA